MISQEKVEQMAQDWLYAWNRHDLDRSMAHYAETIEFISSQFLPSGQQFREPYT
jgi:ketosteroid isomerase-like protein